jgi:hypothetical protein
MSTLEKNGCCQELTQYLEKLFTEHNALKD